MTPGVDSSYSSTFLHAMELLHQGDAEDAERLLRDAVEPIALRYGESSLPWARAHHELGMLLAALGRYDDATVVYRRACRIWDPSDAQATRDHLTYALNLGDLLIRTGHLDEAEEILRRGLARREAFYGRQHAGYGFGLEPLAELLLRTGRCDEALLAAASLVANFWNNTHPRVANALALRAELLLRTDAADPPLSGIEPLPDDVFNATLAATLARADDAEAEHPEVARRLRLAVLQRAEARPVGDLPERVPDALHPLLWEIVEPLLPDDLLDDLSYDLPSGQLHLRLLRDPADDAERERLEIAREAALDALRQTPPPHTDGE